MHAKKHKPIKHQNPVLWRNRESIRLDCKFHITITSKRDEGSPWLISAIFDKHNHEMAPNAAEYSRSALKLNPSMANLTKAFARAGLGMPETRQMLQSKYPSRYFHGKTIRNVMDKDKRDVSHPSSNKAMDLTRLLKKKKQNDQWFVETDIDAITGQLDRVFWMDPDQRSLYSRYHDVVLNDTTAQTNPFGMPLNVTVIVDNSGASRVVALALTRSEATSDYKWILRQIMAACGGKVPHVLVVDEDKAMESACLKVFPRTHIVNCIWHMQQNFKKFVGTYFRSKKNQSQDLMTSFQLAKTALTVREFDRVWSSLTLKCGPGFDVQGSDGQEGEDENQYDHDPMIGVNNKRSGRRLDNRTKINNHLKRLYDRRFHWAQPWTGTRFTAGVRSTQRVEKAHHLIKRLGRSKCSLAQLVKNIDNKVKAERQTRAHLAYQRNVGVTAKDVHEAEMYFGGVQKENERYLGEFGQFEMKKEMASSFYYECKSQKVRKVIKSNDPDS